MPHGSPSGVRLLVRQGGGVIVALPVPRQASLGQARAVLAATTSGPEGESRPDLGQIGLRLEDGGARDVAVVGP